VEYARVHNITLQKSLLSEQTAEYNLEESKAQWQPSLDFSTSHGYTNSPWGNGNKNSYNSSYGLNAGWTVWNGGKRENTIKQNQLQTSINKLNTGEIMRSLETDLLQVYMNILYAKESIGIYEEAVELSKAQEDRGRQFMQSGKMSKVDYSRLQSQYEQDKYALVNAQATYDQRRMELKKLLQLGLDEEVQLEDVEWTAAQVLAALPPMDESYQLAQEIDLQIQGLELQKESSDLDISIAKAGHMPNISLNAGVGTGYMAPGTAFGTSLKQGWNEQVGVSLSVPILDNKKTKMAVARAKVAQQEAELDIEQRRTDLAQLVENWYIETNNAQARYKAAESQLATAKLTDELTNEQFTIGYVNTIELMSAHNDYIEAQHNILQYKYMAMLGQKMIEFYRTATVTL
jgi:outer membrane protein